jgi:hypothetical protein
MDRVECAVCGKLRSRRRCRGVYVEAMGVQYVCFSCRRLPFNEVMDALINGAVYVRGTIFRNITEKERAMRDEKVK